MPPLPETFDFLNPPVKFNDILLKKGIAPALPLGDAVKVQGEQSDQSQGRGESAA